MNIKYKIKEYTFSQLKDEVIIPKFQRSLVWSDEQKKEFITSAINGNPFGILLLFDDIKTKKLIIVDGLQRLTTLIKYNENPFNFVEITKDKYPIIGTITSHIMNDYPDSNNEVISDHIENSIKDLMLEFRNDLKRTSFFSNGVFNKISQIYPLITESQENLIIYQHLNDLWREIEHIITIDQLLIPSIVYIGDKSELPDIFEMLNTKGTTLSKYEVFASTWSNTILKAVDKDIATIVDKRYSSLIEKSDLSIENYIEGEITSLREVTLYEFCFALGRLIKKDNRYLISGSLKRDYSTADSIGFSSMITFLGKHLKYMPDLSLYVNNDVKHSNITKFKNLIIKSFHEVEEILKPYISEFTKYIESQVLSITSTWFNINYEININTLEITERKNHKNLMDRFEKYMPYRFLYDILKNYWAGSGDSKLASVINMELRDNRYLQPVSHELWDQVLNEWFDTQLVKTMKSISSENKLFISFLVSRLDNNYLNKKFIPTHIIPKKFLENSNDLISISNIANIYFIPYKYKTFKESILYGKIDTKDINLYPELERINAVMSNMVNKEKYNIFLRSRFHELKYLFLKNL